MINMQGLILDLDADHNRIIMTGDTEEVWRARRTSIYLRDYLRASLSANGQIVVPAEGEQLGPLLRTIEDSLGKGGFLSRRSAELSAAVADFQQAEDQFMQFSLRAKEIWANEVPPSEFQIFANTLADKLPGRRLYNLQLLAAYHLAFAQNAANFSAPGVGKTSIVYGAFAYLNSLSTADPKYLNKLLVIGPLSSFGPWESEFRECFGRPPRSHRLSGGVLPEYRKRVLYSELPEFRDADLVLASYQSIPNDLEHFRHFLTRPGNEVMVVLDEAHKIKNSAGGVWAEAVLALARFCSARVVLTGTPAPNGYEDLFNLFRFIWPEHDIIKFHVQHLRDMSHNPFDSRIDRLVDNLSPFFIRIRKSDLGLPKPIENPTLLVQMGTKQERIYKFIEEKYVAYVEGRSSESWIRDTLTKARIIRLMQAATNPALLRIPLDSALLGEGGERATTLFIDDADVLAEVQRYSSNETPAKFIAALDLVRRLLSEDQTNKVVIWCVFVANLFALRDLLMNNGIEARILYGGTPTETDDSEEDIETREKIVQEFHRPDSSFRVIIANPFAVGESISLHKACRHAVYVERNFNAAAFLQSKDRIHRYGLPSDAKVNYYYLMTQDTVDGTIHDRLLQKEVAMMKILESRKIPLISLNMESGDVQDDTDDVRAIIRDYIKRRTSGKGARQ
jgi:SNF2 family DNA or RNA helicase